MSALLVPTLQNPSQKFKKSFRLGFLESRKAKLKEPILSGFNLVKEQCDVTWLKVSFFTVFAPLTIARTFKFCPKNM
jgi:hypothetical protein